MTTPSTTVLIDGISDDPPTSEATSLDGEEDSLTPTTTRRHHLELSAGSNGGHEQQYPSVESFNASLDQLSRQCGAGRLYQRWLMVTRIR